MIIIIINNKNINNIFSIMIKNINIILLTNITY